MFTKNRGILRHYTALIIRALSHLLTPLKWLTAITIALGLLSFIDSWWINFPNPLGLYIFLGSICLGMLTLVELFVQGVTLLATKLGHQINYYWGGFLLLFVITMNMRPDLQYAGEITV